MTTAILKPIRCDHEYEFGMAVNWPNGIKEGYRILSDPGPLPARELIPVHKCKHCGDSKKMT